jgi:hypothetical protein
VLRSGQPYEDLGADFYARRESPEQRRAYLLRQLEKLSPGCKITITPSGGRLTTGAMPGVAFPTDRADSRHALFPGQRSSAPHI